MRLPPTLRLLALAAEATGAELELIEEHPANVLRRAELEAAARQPVRVLLELLLLRRHRRDGGAHGGRVDAEAAQLHPREARDERHFLRGVRPVEALAAQPLLNRRRARVRQRRRLAAQVPRGAARSQRGASPTMSRCCASARREVFAVGAERAGRVDHPRADERVAELAAHGDAPREEERELVLEVVPHLHRRGRPHRLAEDRHAATTRRPSPTCVAPAGVAPALRRLRRRCRRITRPSAAAARSASSAVSG